MEYASLGKFVLALFFVLGLIGIAALIAKKVMSEKKWLSKLASQGRLGLVETIYIDSRHKLVLIKRDEAEHLLLIGNDTSLVVEANIKKSPHA